MLAYMHICTHIYIFARMYVHKCISVRIHAHMCAYIHIWSHTCIYAHIHVYNRRDTWIIMLLSETDLRALSSKQNTQSAKTQRLFYGNSVYDYTNKQMFVEINCINPTTTLQYTILRHDAMYSFPTSTNRKIEDLTLLQLDVQASIFDHPALKRQLLTT